MSSPTECLECGAPLGAGDLQGVCPKCLLKLGLASQLISGTLPATHPGLLSEGAVAEPFDFGDYRILRLLGKGGMGAVYEAEQRSTGRRVALKVLGQTIDSAEMRLRFLREGQLAASVRHPNVVAIFSAEEVEGVPVIAMEMVADGSLKDRVKRKGPLPVPEAVDAVLQMIDGLETAERAGVLHRDIKPANCFVAHDGTVKVGDFGLSISTLAKAETQLTESGAVLGTPAFASPEQLRGREIDVRSDIYAVGATLYFLLTGKPIHDAESLVSLIASVLEQTPSEPRTLRTDLPEALSRVVMRCLAKSPAARPQTYADLRSALLPFSSIAPSAAMLGMRFLAGVIDTVVAFLPSFSWMLATGDRPVDLLVINRDPSALGVFLLFAFIELLYFALPEGFWGASLGKMLCGLRVVRYGRPPGILRAAARALILYVPEFIGAAAAALTMTGLEYDRTISGPVVVWSDALTLIVLLALFSTMRRRNGFAAIHDLLTGTRVVAKSSALQRPPLALPSQLSPHASGPTQIGPYAVVEKRGALVLATDLGLKRPVWIRSLPARTPAVSAARRDLHRPGRLRWLNGRRSAEENWDAYEAPHGIALTAALDRSQPWSTVRFWLHDLSEEITGADRDGTLPAEIGNDQVWLTHDGRAVLLEFPAPDALPCEKQRTDRPDSVQHFLHRIAAGALGPVVPLHAHGFLSALHECRFEVPAQIAGNLRELVSKIPTITRRRRLFGLAFPVLLALVMAWVTAATLNLASQEFDIAWQREHASLFSLRQVLHLRAYEDLSPENAERLDRFLAGKYRPIIADDAFWGRPQTIAVIDNRMQTAARQAVAKFPAVSASDLDRAEQRLAPILARQLRRDRIFAAWLMPFFTAFFLCTMLIVGALSAAIFRAPPGLRLLGAIIVRDDGKPVSRWRIALRSAPTLIVAFLTTVLLAGIAFEFHPALLAAIAIGLLTLLIGAITCVRHPTRGLPDRLARTLVVPV